MIDLSETDHALRDLDPRTRSHPEHPCPGGVGNRAGPARSAATTWCSAPPCPAGHRRCAGIESMVGSVHQHPAGPGAPRPAGDAGRRCCDRVQGEQAALLDHHYVGLDRHPAGSRAAAPLFDTLTVFESYPVDRGGAVRSDRHRRTCTSSASTARTPRTTRSPSSRRATRGCTSSSSTSPRSSTRRRSTRSRTGCVRVLDCTPPTSTGLVAGITCRCCPSRSRSELLPARGRPGRSDRDAAADLRRREPRPERDRTALVAGRERDLPGTRRAVESAGPRAHRATVSGPETFVALGVPRSIESVLAVWAVAKTGAAFVPVDPNYPPSASSTCSTDSGATLGLTMTGTSGRPARRRTTGSHWTTRPRRARAPPKSLRRSPTRDRRVADPALDNAAYVDLHVRLDRQAQGRRGHPPRSRRTSPTSSVSGSRSHETSRTLHFSSPSFDASVLEYSAGVRRRRDDGDRAAHRVRRRRNSPDFCARDGHPRIRHPRRAGLGRPRPASTSSSVVVVGGEACPPELVRTLGPGPRMFNAYGPTETTIMRQHQRPDDGRANRSPSAARSAASRELVLDRTAAAGPGRSARRAVHRRRRSGPRLPPASGAHRRTVRRRPLRRPGERMYRTGDVVRWRRRRTRRVPRAAATSR